MRRIRFRSVVNAMIVASLAAATACSESTSPSASPGSGSLSVTKLDNTVFGSAPVRFHPHAGEVTTTQFVSGMGNVHVKFSSIEEACLVFAFSDDLLDSGDHLHITLDGSDAGGFLNPGSESQATRTLCWVPEVTPTIIADLLDGKSKVKFIMEIGSFTLASVTLTISGTPR